MGIFSDAIEASSPVSITRSLFLLLFTPKTVKQYDDPKPTNHHNEFDNLMGVLMANVSVKYPHTLPLVKDALHKIMLHTYNGLRQEIQALNVNNENKAARLSL